MKKFIPVSEPVLKKIDIKTAIKSLNAKWISFNGPDVKKFEFLFSKYIGHKYSATVSSGTAALEIAIKSLNLKKGDEVIIPDFTIISNALAVIKQGLKLKFVDCDLYDWNMNINKLLKSITKKTKAIIVTHIYNYPFRIDLIKKICEKKKIFIIEDAAEVLGQDLLKKKCGSYGDISTFSFYANKQITTGEGGMISTNNKKIFYNILNLRNLCFGKDNRFEHTDIGWNYRMTNMQACLGMSQLKRINQIVKKKKYIGKIYFNFLKNNKNIFIPEPSRYYSENIYWVVAVLIVNKKITAKEMIKKLLKYGIEARPFFYPMHKQKILKKFMVNYKKYPNSTFISKFGLYLPSSNNLSVSKIKFICEKLNSILS